MAEDYVKLTREQLYERVWSKPTTHLASELGISDVALAKTCKKLNVPKPNPGYWQKLAAGTAPAKPSLPSVAAKMPGHIMIRTPVVPPSRQEARPEAAARIDEVRDPASRIVVSQRLANQHPLVEASKAAFARGEPDEFGRVHRARNTDCLDIRVSRKSLRRALLLMDALVKAIEVRGCTVEVAKRYGHSARVVVHDEAVDVYLWEEVRRSDNPEPPPDAKDRWMWRKWSFTPTGTLVFIVDSYGSESARKRWKDGKRRRLEEQLNDILAAIFIAAEAKAVRRLQAAEEERRREEARVRWEECERLRIEEEGRRNALEEAARSWAKSENLRAFLDECEARMKTASCSPGDSARDERWLEWARCQADRLDPFENGSVGNLIRDFETSSTR